MTIKIDRRWRKPAYTISRVYVNGKYFGCNALEDTDRGLVQSMPLEQIKKIKIKKETAIPRGYYDVNITYSPKYRKMLPIVQNVPGFSGIRMHSGNSNKDTEGCILFGKNDKVGWISNSTVWTNKIIDIIKAALKKKEKVTLIVG